MAAHRTPPNRTRRRTAIALGLAAVAVVAAVAPAIAHTLAGPKVVCEPAPLGDGGKFTLSCHVEGGPVPGTTVTAKPSPTKPSPTTTTTATKPPQTTTTTTPATTKPPVTTSPTGNRKLTNCFTRLAECGYPTRETTGVRSGRSLTAAKGRVITTSGTVLDGLDIKGCITISASNVTIRNSRITGECFAVIHMQSGSLTIEDSEINCVNGEGNGIAWKHFTARRVYIHDCENALEMGEGSSVVDSYLSAREGAPTSHGDVIQSQGGEHVTIRHNTFAGLNPLTSSIITNPTRNHHWLVEDNFLSAGAYTLYCPEEGTDFVVRNNRFYPPKLWPKDPHSAAFGLTDACRHSGIVWDGNYRDDNLETVRP